MEFFENLGMCEFASCPCDEHCGADEWGCDDGNEGWHSGDDD